MADNEFKHGWVAQVLVEKLEGTVQIIVLNQVFPKTFKPEKAAASRLTASLIAQLKVKHPDWLIQSEMRAAVADDKAVYVLA